VGEASCACKEDSQCKSKSGNTCLPLICVDGYCQVDVATQVVCDTSNDTSCVKNTCDPTEGVCAMKPIAEGVACDDGNACTPDATCLQGTCAGKGVVTCDDKNPCTTDSCSTDDGCLYLPNTDTCTDNDKCTSADACSNGACLGKAADCDDGVACTKDTCAPDTGKCANATTAAQCDDNNPCTADVCHKTKGCDHSPDSKAKCDDGDDCTKDAC
jgi:hypothetical protein